MIKQTQLMQVLSEMGFQRFVPACATWKAAFVYQYDNKVLVVLVRRTGVDLRYYNDFDDQIYLNKSAKLSLNEGQMLTYSYAESHLNVHDQALKIANDFTHKIIDSSILCSQNRGHIASSKVVLKHVAA